MFDLQLPEEEDDLGNFSVSVRFGGDGGELLRRFGARSGGVLLWTLLLGIECECSMYTGEDFRRRRSLTSPKSL